MQWVIIKPDDNYDKEKGEEGERKRREKGQAGRQEERKEGGKPQEMVRKL